MSGHRLPKASRLLVLLAFALALLLLLQRPMRAAAPARPHEAYGLMDVENMVLQAVVGPVPARAGATN